jgi:hypothetical protein
MTRKPKFRPGAEPLSLLDVIGAVQDGRWLYWCGRPKHPSVIANMKVSTVSTGARAGIVRAAIPTENEGGPA